MTTEQREFRLLNPGSFVDGDLELTLDHQKSFFGVLEIQWEEL